MRPAVRGSAPGGTAGGTAPSAQTADRRASGPLAPDLARVAAVLAADPQGLGGVWIRGPVGPERDRFLELLHRLSPGRGARKIPAGTPPARLFGGLDLTETLRRGRPAFLPGLLAAAHGGWVTVPDAEGLSPELWGPLLGVLDRGEVVCERGGFSRRDPARFGLVAMDEAREADPATAGGILDRLAFWVEVPPRHLVEPGPWSAEEVGRAGARARSVAVSDEAVRALVGSAAALGVASMRAPVFALRAARISAGLRGAVAVEEEDVLFAVRAVLVPRGVALPEAPPDEAAEAAEDPAHPDDGDADAPDPRDRGPDPSEPPEPGEDTETDPSRQGRMSDRVVAAVRTALPDLPLPTSGAGARGSRGRGGRRGERIRAPSRRGRLRSVRPGDPRDGRPLDVLATVRAAAPWQRLRGREEGDARLRIRAEDLRVRHLEAPRVTTTVFVVDGSGSHAARRLAEAKGAVELLLAGSYVRREEVALVVFRNRSAEVALPMTRSLARARRVLAGLPGGGGTPVAAGLDAGLRLALDARRSGTHPRLVLLTDGKANVDLQGRGGRPRALDDALRVARGVGAAGLELLVLDTSPRGQANTERIAEAAGGRRVRLPAADARTVHATLARAEDDGPPRRRGR